MIGLLAVILALTFYKPFGIIDFSKFEGADLLVAEREGSANSNTTLKLKEDFTFKERDINFGINEIKGNYHLQNDTIYFDNVNIGRSGNGFYKFAIIKPSIFSNDKIVADLIMFKELTDTTGRLLWITKNQLDKLKAKKQGR